MIGAGLAIPELAVRARRPAGGPGAPPPAFSFPALSAAYAAGRAIVTLIGDSTTFGIGAGEGGGNSTTGVNAANTAHFLRAALNAAGRTAIDGCAVFGAMNRFSNPQQVPSYYGSGMTVGAGWTYNWTEVTCPWQRFAYQNGGDNSLLSFDPGFAWDRAELFLSTWDGAGQSLVGLGAGATQLATPTVTDLELLRYPVSKPLADEALTIGWLNYAGFGVGGVRLWNSAVQHVQIETMGCPSWETTDWATTGTPNSALDGLSMLGSHLFVINLGLNDKFHGRDRAAYKTNLTAIAAKAKASGADVLLCVPLPADPGDGTSTSGIEFDASWRAVPVEVAAGLGLPPPLDLRAVGIVAADYEDGLIHLLPQGYAKVGAATAARLLA